MLSQVSNEPRFLEGFKTEFHFLQARASQHIHFLTCQKSHVSSIEDVKEGVFCSRKKVR